MLCSVSEALCVERGFGEADAEGDVISRTDQSALLALLQSLSGSSAALSLRITKQNFAWLKAFTNTHCVFPCERRICINFLNSTLTSFSWVKIKPRWRLFLSDCYMEQWSSTVSLWDFPTVFGGSRYSLLQKSQRSPWISHLWKWLVLYIHLGWNLSDITMKLYQLANKTHCTAVQDS